MRRASRFLLVGAATAVLAGEPGCAPRRLTATGPGGDAAVGIAPDGGPGDEGTSPDASSAPGSGADGGGAADAASPSPSPDGGGAPAHGGSSSSAAPVSLAGACGSDLQVAGPLRATDGTLAAPGPYRPCRLLAGHRYTTVRLSDDGRRMAALTSAGQILVLDSRTLTPLAVLARARGPYGTVALSSDGAIVAAGSDIDGELDVWRVADHAVLLAVDLGPTWPTLGGALAVSKDATRVATVNGAGIVIADIASGTMRTLPASRLATALFFVDGDRKLAFGGGQFWAAGTGHTRIDLIDIASGAVQTLVDHDDIYGTDQLEASADGATLLTFGHGELAVWDAATGQKRSLPLPSWQAGTFSVYGLSADGSELATSLSDAQDVWFQRRRSSDNTVVDELRIDATARPWYAWSSPARLLVAGVVGADGVVALATVDLAARRLQAKGCSGRMPGQLTAFSADGQRLLTRPDDVLGEGAIVFDVATGRTQATFPDAAPTPSAGTLVPGWRASADWRWSAWTSEVAENGMVTKQAHVMALGGGDERILLDWRSASYGSSIAFSADARRLAVVESPGRLLTVLDVESGASLSAVALPGSYPSAMDFMPDGSSLLIREDGAVRTVRWTDGATLALVATGSSYVSAAPDGTVVAFGLDAASTYRDGAALATMPGITDSCFGLVPEAILSDDGSTVALGESCSRIQYLSRAPHADIRATTTGALIQQVTQAAPVVFSPDASMFAGGGGLLWCRGDPGQ